MIPNDIQQAAILFAERYSSKYGRSKNEEVWYYFNGKSWVKDVGAVVIRKSVHAFVNDLMAEARGIDDKTQRDIAVERASKFNTSVKYSEIIKEAMGYMLLSEDGEDVFDKNPLVLNVHNGTIDLNTMMLHPHKWSDYNAKITPTVFDPVAKCSRWEAHIEWVTGGDKETAWFLQKLLGYMITGLIREQIFVVAYGTGANGKGTLFTAFQRVLGQYGCTLSTSTLMEGDVGKFAASPGLAKLRGKRFAIAGESKRGDKLDTGLIKSLTGGDRQTARGLFEGEIEFDPTCKFVFHTNHTPVLNDTSRGMQRRMIAIPFNREIPFDEIDKTLDEKLKTEDSGILNWVLVGCQGYLTEGLGTCPEVATATSEYLADNDVLGSFIKETLVVRANASLLVSKAYEEYQQWCKDSGRDPWTKQTFVKAMKEKGHVTKQGHSRTTYFDKLALRAEGD